jgi:ABC-type uncharacterized transport system ATPase subunit
VLLLDEPTLGLDLHGQTAIRQFIGDYSSRTEATVLLTSHYMADVTALAQRSIVIDHGRLRYDGDLSARLGTAVLAQACRRDRVDHSGSHRVLHVPAILRPRRE